MGVDGLVALVLSIILLTNALRVRTSGKGPAGMSYIVGMTAFGLHVSAPGSSRGT